MGAFLLAARSVTQTIAPNSGVPGRDSRPAVTLGVAHRCVHGALAPCRLRVMGFRESFSLFVPMLPMPVFTGAATEATVPPPVPSSQCLCHSH